MMTDVQTEVVRRAKDGDSAAFQELVNTWRRRILGMASRLTGRPEEAEDIAQEVFVRVYFSLDRLREPGQFEPWLYRIATNSALDFLRRHRRCRVRLSDLSEEQLVTVERGMALREASDRLQQNEVEDLAGRVLDMLSPEDRSLLVLKEIEGLSVKEIGEVYGVREETIKVRLFRARQRIIQKLSHTADTGLAREAAARGWFNSHVAATA